MEVGMCEEAESGRVYKWEIEPHPYTNEFDVYVTDFDEEARQAILHAAEMYLWDSNEGEDDGPHGKSRVLKVTHNAGHQILSEAK
jgi:hypothetical protein